MEEISFKQAKVYELRYQKAKSKQKFLVIMSITLAIICFFGGIAIIASELEFFGLIVMSCSFLLPFLIAKITDVPIPEEKLLQKFLTQEREKAVNAHTFSFEINNKSLQSKKLEEYIKTYLDHKIYYNPNIPLENQLNFDKYISDMQNFLNNSAQSFNLKEKQDEILAKVKKFVEEIKDKYNKSEYDLIISNFESWKWKYLYGIKNLPTMYEAEYYITHMGNKKIATKEKIEEFDIRKSRLINSKSKDDIEWYNSDVKSYYFSNSHNYIILYHTPTSYYSNSNSYYSQKSSRYINHCWNCKATIDEDTIHSSRKCYKCGGYHCRMCGACLCGSDTITRKRY